MVSIITKYLLTIQEFFFLLLRYIDVFLFIFSALFNQKLSFYFDAFFYRYKQLFFTASFFHVIFKIIIKFILGFNFIFMDNIILFIILYIIAHILDLYQYIYEIIGSIGIYFFNPLASFINFELYTLCSKSIIADMFDTKFPYTINNIYDRFFFGFFFFFPFFILRYFILREPLLFGVINMLFIISYLVDYNILLTYIYIIILHISRFMFYLSDESYSYKKYNEIWLDYVQEITALFNNNSLLGYNSKIIIQKDYPTNTIFKLTFYNLRLAILISNRHFIATLIDNGYSTSKERKIARDTYAAAFLQNSFFEVIANHSFVDLFCNLSHCEIIDRLFKHAHRFVFTNRFFLVSYSNISRYV